MYKPQVGYWRTLQDAEYGRVSGRQERISWLMMYRSRCGNCITKDDVANQCISLLTSSSDCMSFQQWPVFRI